MQLGLSDRWEGLARPPAGRLLALWRLDSYETTCQDPHGTEGRGGFSSADQTLFREMWKEAMAQRVCFCFCDLPLCPLCRSSTNFHSHPFGHSGAGTSSPRSLNEPRDSSLLGGPGLLCYFESQSGKHKLESGSSAFPVILTPLAFLL